MFKNLKKYKTQIKSRENFGFYLLIILTKLCCLTYFKIIKYVNLYLK